jgi:sec-independent protein translocase protein TatA
VKGFKKGMQDEDRPTAQLPDESRNGQQQTKADSTQRNDEQPR